ncbi:hypothetical protein [Silanimonas lenta]|uniref:hypothetical protein n=1 Tax=Silanimonas lenta TaxID=265429 RepID=UPI000403AF90|nr:hypothetical protein [Silanimonas lenta]
MRPPVLALALAVALLPFAAGAQQASTLEERMSAADFKRAGLDKLSEEELAALNAWLQRHGSGAVAVAAAGEDLRGFRRSSARNNAPIVSRLVGESTGWTLGTLIELENGQVWRVTDTSGSFGGVRLVNPVVEIRPGLIGGWIMKFQGYNSSARVERVK